jgi:hypothetical protein
MSVDANDIISIDRAIKDKFKEEKLNLTTHKDRLDEVNNSIERIKENPTHRIMSILIREKDELTTRIRNIERDNEFNHYTCQTAELIQNYEAILNAPMKVSFLGKKGCNNKKKKNIIKEYIESARKYINIDFKKELPSKDIVCGNCSCKKFDNFDSNVYVCQECSAQHITTLCHTPSPNDKDRVGMSSKYMYDRKVHFRDCINQYQGKQNSTIPQKVYDDLEDQFEKHHKLNGDRSISKDIRFKNVTKELILIFLRELSYNKHYENVHLIHYNFTGVKPDDITYLEDQLLDDFDTLTSLYDKMFKHLTRKNFINTQYVLYQLLCRHKHTCNREDFSILKTIDRKAFHDDICKSLFSHLAWNHVSFF